MSHTWLEISKSALQHNIQSICGLIGEERKLFVVVKANAYGHGLNEVASVIEDKVDYFAVATLEEAQNLRKAGRTRPILVLAYFPFEAEAVNWAVQERVEATVHSLDHARKLAQLVKDGELRVHVKIDTGLGRLGISVNEAVATVREINKLARLHIKGVFSHLADPFGNIAYTNEQLQNFRDIKKQLVKSGLDSQLYHIAKTTAILSQPESLHNAVRLGVGLYGIWPAKELKAWMKKEKPDFSLKPALTWKAKILQIKDYPADSYVGYGCTYKTRCPSRLAIVPVGYYEGYDRGLSNQGVVLIRGQRCPVRGLVCMNMIIVDVTEVEHVSEHDEVVLIGQQGDEEITARELAEMCHTINYEIVTRINPLIERKLVN
ncbi:MAG: alanine racemase [Patescibacteria group bacterium]